MIFHVVSHSEADLRRFADLAALVACVVSQSVGGGGEGVG